MKSSLLNTTIDDYLFSKKLDEVIKCAKAMETTSKDLKVTPKATTSKYPKNLKAPPRPKNKDQGSTSGGQRKSSRTWSNQSSTSQRTRGRKETESRRRR